MERTPRERVVITAVHHLRARGVTGTGLRPLVADAGAPWGSFAHYFPGGKDQVVCEALDWAGAFAASIVTRYVETARRPTALGLWHAVVTWWVDDLTRHNFALGCPVAAAIADSAEGSEPIRSAAAAAMQTWRAPIRDGLVGLSFTRRDADELSTVLLAGLAGGIILARAERNVAPLRVVERRLRPLLVR
jgi:AcrR family transcriptional regulator